ncbi:MAG: efflux RND transporter permease subunit, partial [Pseudomonadota bacterium]
ELRTSDRQFTVRADARLNDAADFARVVVKELEGGPVRLEDVARVSLGVEDDQTELRTNGVTSVGLSILRQSQANTVAISNQVRQEIAELANNLPPGMEILVAFDEANFVQASIQEVVKTLGITILIVVAVIFLFLGSGRALIVPAVTIPVALIGTFLGIYLFGFSINTLSLLALVLAVGILVDDAIVILENIQHHMARGATAAAASIVGTKQVFFAVIATSLTLISVFVPVSLMEGKIGLLFAEFGIVMALIVVVSTFVALTLCPMLASKLLQAGDRPNRLTGGADRAFARLEACYAAGLSKVIQAPWLVVLLTVALGVAAMGLYNKLPKELTTLEDRGVFFVSLTGPQGANFDYTNGEMRDVEHRLQPLLDSGEAEVVRSMSGFRGNSHRGFAVVSLADWDERDRSSAEIAGALIEPLSQVTGARAFPVLPAGLGLRGSRQPLQLVIGGYDHQEVKSWADSLIPVLEQNPNLLNIEVDYEENQPEFKVEVDRLRADDLGVSVEAIGRTLQSMIASQKVTTFVDRGREYDVIVQSDEGDRRNPHDLTSIYLKSDTSGQLVPLDALVSVNEGASAADLRRYERLPSITLSAALADGYDLGAAIAFATQAAQETLPDEARLAYSGLSKEFTDSAGAIFASVALAILVVYLVLAAQFESFRQPFVILLTVPLAVSGALLALWLTGTSLNIFSQIGLILLIGLMAKNGILIVDYANQLQAQGLGTREAALQAAQRRLRPIVMTLLSTLLGAIPLVMASGAGAESRFAIGTVIIGGLSATLCLTLFVIPVFYELFSARDKKQTAVPSPQGAKHLATDHPGQT